MSSKIVADGRNRLLPVCKHGKSAISLDDTAHHADLLRSKELQRQGLTRHQHHSRVRQHGDCLTAVVIVDCTAVKLLHV